MDGGLFPAAWPQRWTRCRNRWPRPIHPQCLGPLADRPNFRHLLRFRGMGYERGVADQSPIRVTPRGAIDLACAVPRIGLLRRRQSTRRPAWTGSRKLEASPPMVSAHERWLRTRAALTSERGATFTRPAVDHRSHPLSRVPPPNQPIADACPIQTPWIQWPERRFGSAQWSLAVADPGGRQARHQSKAGQH